MKTILKSIIIYLLCMGCDKADHTTEIGSLLGNTYMFALVSSEAACEISLNNGIN